MSDTIEANKPVKQSEQGKQHTIKIPNLDPKPGDWIWTCIGGTWDRRMSGLADRPVAPYKGEVLQTGHLCTVRQDVKGRLRNLVLINRNEMFLTEQEAWVHLQDLTMKEIAGLEAQIKNKAKKLATVSQVVRLFKTLPDYKPDVGSVEICDAEP